VLRTLTQPDYTTFLYRGRYGVKYKMRPQHFFLAILPATVHIPLMDVTPEAISDVMKALGRRGGFARAQNMSAKERRASALKASKAAAEARKKKARAKKRLGKELRD